MSWNCFPSTLPKSGADPVVAPEGLVQTPGFAVAQEQILVALKARSRVAVLGGLGSGKTTILRTLHATLRGSGAAVELLLPGEALPARSRIVLVDDAHEFSESAWSALILRPSPWVIAGLPWLRDRLIAQRRMTIVDVPPLSAAEIFGFVAALLRRSGEPATLVSDAAVTRLGMLSEGVPGRLVTMLRLAIFLARLEEAATVTGHHVEQALAFGDEEQLPDPAGDAPAALPHRVRPGRRLVVGLAVIGLAGTIVLPERLPGPDSAARQTIEADPPTASVIVPVIPATVAVLPVVPAPFPLPPTAPLHIVLLIAGSSPDARSRSQSIVQTLRDRGYEVAGILSAPPGLPTPEVRYYFADDATAAAQLAKAAGFDPTAVRLLTPARGVLPRPGTVEIVATAPATAGKPT